MVMDEEKILQFWFRSRNLSKNTRISYENAIRAYSKYTNKTITELYQEGRQDEEEKKWITDRDYIHDSLDFIDHLKEDKSRSTVNIMISAIIGFYKAHQITPPELKHTQGDIALEKNFGQLLTKEEIQRLAAVATPRNRALIYLMSLSGFSQNEVSKLTIGRFHDAVNKELQPPAGTIPDLFHRREELRDTTLILEVIRTKVHYRHLTCIPPETVDKVLTYLEERYHYHQDPLDDYDSPLLLRKNGGSLSLASVSSTFQHLGELAGFHHRKGVYRYWRSHGLRRYFISTIISEMGDTVLADFLAGHKISDQQRTYWRANPDKLRERYLKALNYLSLDGVQVDTITSSDKKKLIHLERQQELMKENFNDFIIAAKQNPEKFIEILKKM